MIKLSASRIKTYFDCSWIYLSKYVNKIPDVSNSGAARGSVTHNILECLLREDRRPLVKQILDQNDPFLPQIKRMARMLAKKFGVWNPEDFELIRNFLLVALKLDFYKDGADVEAEYEFNIKKQNWHIGGFVDKIAVYDDRVEITDYKTSKSVFTKDELEFNLQNYFYCYAVKNKFPEKEVELHFHFLKKGVLQKAPVISDAEMRGFEEWLGHIGSFLSNFSFKDGMSGVAKGNYLKHWLCGKPPGTLKKTGEVAFTCKFRVPFIYFDLIENGKSIKTSRVKSELEAIKKDNQEIIERSYQGCTAWQKEWKND